MVASLTAMGCIVKGGVLWDRVGVSGFGGKVRKD